jgi:glycine/D-amino acid oxidase-like deaminating enzyme
MTTNHDLIVLGAGSAGLAIALRAAGHGARVALLDPRELGGTCVHRGCVPKKALWFAAQLAHAQQLALEVGFDSRPGRSGAEHDQVMVCGHRRIPALFSSVAHAGNSVAPWRHVLETEPRRRIRRGVDR